MSCRGPPVCNVTMDHTARVGDKLTYVCSTNFQGLPKKGKFGTWTGPGVEQKFSVQKIHRDEVCEKAAKNTCFRGKSRI